MQRACRSWSIAMLGRRGRLRGHVARANTQWRYIDGVAALVLFPITDGYVSPSSYPSKAEHGKVVPTWNYEVVHVHGTVQIHDDPEWLRELVTDLTDQHEAARSVDRPWAVTDAPATSSTNNCGPSSASRCRSSRSRANASSARTDPRPTGWARRPHWHRRRADGDQAVAEAMGRLPDARELTTRIADAPYEPVPRPVDTGDKFGTTRRDRFHGNGVDGVDRSGSVYG